MDGASGAVGACGRNAKRQQAGEKKILHQASTSDHTPKRTFSAPKRSDCAHTHLGHSENSPMKKITNMARQDTHGSLGSPSEGSKRQTKRVQLCAKKVQQAATGRGFSSELGFEVLF